MATWCLPRNLQTALLDALTNGTLDRHALMSMTSEQRRAAFAGIVGDENAREINSQFESKMLLKNAKAGMVTWARNLTGVTEPARRDMIAKINKLDRVLNPVEQRDFLADLARTKLGVGVTADEARQIFQLSQDAERLRQAIVARTGDYRTSWTADSGTAYGRALMALQDRIEELKPGGRSSTDWVLEALGLSKSFLTGIGHLSAPFVQGWGMMATKEMWQGIGSMLQYFASEEKYRDLEAYILGHPDYELARDAKLGLTKITDRMTDREEQIQSSLLQDLSEFVSAKTGLFDIVRASSRGFTGYLNFVRFNAFTNALTAARALGVDVSRGSKDLHDIANVVNNFSGRGELGKGDRFGNIGPALNQLAFAPRKIVATVEMFNPVKYATLSPFARQMAARQLVGSLMITATVLGLAQSMGAKVNWDPRSTDFAKIDIGGQKFDITGGNSSFLRMVARVITGQALTAAGKISDKVYVHGTAMPARFGAAAGWILGKAAPVASILIDAAWGKDAAGQVFNMTNRLRDEFTPIVINNYIQYWGNNPDDAIAELPMLATILGVGVESPFPPLSQSGRDAFGEPIPETDQFWRTSPRRWTGDPVVQEARRLDVQLRPAEDKIRGIKLDAQQLDDYARLGGRLAHARLEQVIASPNWNVLTPDIQRKAIEQTMRHQYEQAAKIVMAQSIGGPNDIVAQAREAKMAKAAEKRALMAVTQ